MFGDYVLSRLAVDYERRVLVFDPDDVIHRCGLESRVKKKGFEILHLDAMDPIKFRYVYESEYRESEKKILFVVQRESTFLPYDVRKKCFEVNLSYESLYPKLDASVLRNVKNLDLNLLYLTYRNYFGGYAGEDGTREFLTHEMYSKKTAVEYAEWLLASLHMMLDHNQTYVDWFETAKQWAVLRMLRDGGFTNMDLEPISVQIENRFQCWLFQHYKRLSASYHVDSPVLLHKTTEYIKLRSKKPALIVVDGMSLENWLTFERNDEFSGFTYETSCVFALIPTITIVSRLSLLSGKLPTDLSKPFVLSNEEKEWRMFWRNSGYKDNEIAFLRGADWEIPSGVKVVGIIINTVDDLMHGQTQGQFGMYRDIVSWSKSGELQELILRLLELGFDVFITSDHGNVEAVGQGRPPGEGILTEVTGQRCRIYQGFADTTNIESTFRTIKFPNTYLPKEFQYVLSEAGLSFQTRGKRAICHGGMSLEEVIVPFIQVKGVKVG